MTCQSQGEREYCQGGVIALEEGLQSITQPSAIAKGTGGQLSLQNLSDLHGPSKISVIIKGNERSHPVSHPSSRCQKQSRCESPFVFVFVPGGTE